MALSGSAVSAADTLDSRLPIISLIHPDGGEIFQSTVAETLRWTIDEESWLWGLAPVNLKIRDGETLLLDTQVIPQISGDYTYQWHVSEAHTPNAVFSVEATDRFGNTDRADSDPFQILGSLADTPAVVHRDGLYGASPNPFNPGTTISYSLRESASVELAVFDLRGRRIVALDVGNRTTGQHRISWDGRDNDGAPVPSGTYLARLRLSGTGRSDVFTTHLTLVK